uniref:Uncharacterized protein n=1 Tax=Anguilla anguilla TaxID=7936 RepID=A0A0E9PZP9_ANGAN
MGKHVTYRGSNNTLANTMLQTQQEITSNSCFVHIADSLHLVFNDPRYQLLFFFICFVVYVVLLCNCFLLFVCFCFWGEVLFISH